VVRRLWQLGVSVLALATAAAAGTPDWVKAAAREPVPAYPDEIDAVVLYYEQVTVVKSENDTRTLTRYVCKVLHPEGRHFGMIAVPYTSTTRLTSFKAWSISPTGLEYEMKEKDAVESSDFDVQYSDTRRKTMYVSSSEPGSIVAWETEQMDRPDVLQDLWDFQDVHPVRHARYTLDLPNGWKYQTYWRNHAAVDPSSNGNRWTWQLDDVPAVRAEVAMPTWSSLAGKMSVAYFRQGEAPNWAAVGKWYAALASDRLGATPELKAKVLELAPKRPIDAAGIRALSHFVQQQVRYVAVEIGVGGYQPHVAGQVFGKRYGDCKDKVTLLMTMLREAGVESYYVLTHSARGTIDQKFPSPRNFDHVIIAIRPPSGMKFDRGYAQIDHPKLGRLVLFDPTSDFTGFGQLPSSLQGNQGLLVAEGGGEFIGLPLAPPEANSLYHSVRFELGANGGIAGGVNESRQGFFAEGPREELMAMTPLERGRYMESHVRNMQAEMELKSADVFGVTEVDDDIMLRYRVTAARFGQVSGPVMLLRTGVFPTMSSFTLEDKNRRQPLELTATSVVGDSVQFNLPDGYEVEELPPPLELKYPFGLYQRKVEMSKQTLTVSRTRTILQPVINVEQLDAARDFFRQIADDERSVIVLRKK